MGYFCSRMRACTTAAAIRALEVGELDDRDARILRPDDRVALNIDGDGLIEDGRRRVLVLLQVGDDLFLVLPGFQVLDHQIQQRPADTAFRIVVAALGKRPGTAATAVLILEDRGQNPLLRDRETGSVDTLQNILLR
jgi:hypothetical protein